MVSPSKNAEPSNSIGKFDFQSNKKPKPNTVRGTKNKTQKSKKPYGSKIFYLDLKSSRETTRLGASVQILGGRVAVFLDRSVTHVITDRLGVNISIASPAASISPLPTPSPSNLDRSNLPRSRGTAMLERATHYVSACYADPIQLAHQWSIPVLSVSALWRDIYSLEASRENRRKSCTARKSKVEKHFVKVESTSGTMTRRPYKNSITSEEDSSGANVTNKSSTLCNGHVNRHSSQEDLKVQCNGLSNSHHRSAKLLSPSGSDVLPLPSQRRSTRRASASWCGSTRELAQLSPTDSELGVTLRPKGTLWLPVALIGTTAEEHGNGVRPKRKKLSPEEKLLQDNKEYFKMEVLNTKLRSSGSLLNLNKDPPQPQIDKIILKKVKGRSKRNNWTKTKEVECMDDSVDYEALIVENKIMKMNGINNKPKRARRSELMKLCDEAESFMFGESSRLSAVSEDDRKDDTSLDSSSWDDSKLRRKRRSHAEAFIHDNIDYYKFETPGSRLRNQGSICESETKWDGVKEEFYDWRTVTFSFQTVPKDEPWYDVYKRQDEGKEMHFPVVSDPSNQPFLLPYELPRPVYASQEPSDYYVKRRKRLAQILSQNHPRKSPRCHASTLAILSSLKKRKRKSSTAEHDVSPTKQNDVLGLLSDVEVDEVPLLDPDEPKSEANRRRKKTEDRLVLRTVEPEIVIETSKQSQPMVDVLELIERFRYDNDLIEPDYVASILPSLGRIPKKRKKCRKVNRTGWDKAKVRKSKRAPRNCGIEAENIVTSTRRSRSSVEEPIQISPCLVRVRKLKSPENVCRKLVFNNRKRRVTDYSWTTTRKR